MSDGWFLSLVRLVRGVPAVMAVLVLVALAGGGQAAAAARLGGTAARLAGGQAAGVISTVAGGPGGPAEGTTVALHPCGVGFAGGRVYLADGG